MTDETDNWFSFLRGGSSGSSMQEVISARVPVCAQFSDYYNVTHKKRGIALIFNHQFFDDRSLNHRQGTIKDRDYLDKVLSKLEFDVRVYNDLKFGQIFSVIKKVSQEDHSEHDCILVCVMSHGTDGKIYARDHTYDLDTVLTLFSGNNCTTLAGKPKLFFIQACRGSEIDDGATVRNSSTIEEDSCGSMDETYSIPAMADFLIMYSSYEGYFSWRSPDKGSWFIQSLCHELEARHNSLDLLSILTFVNRRVALAYESNVPMDHSMHKKKQVCTIVSMLTRLFAFASKKVNDMETDGVVTVDNKENIEEDETNNQKNMEVVVKI